MTPTAGPRPGGRSARIQQAVRASARALLEWHERADITVPMIATDAGVTPSTIYRRWGDINEVFADVSIEQLRPDAPPRETGSLRGDLTAWSQEYLEEMSTSVGRAALRDVLMSDDQALAPDGTKKFKCAFFCRTQIDVILARWPEASAVDGDSVVDHVVAPIVYRILFDLEPLSLLRVSELVDQVLAPKVSV
ncbi:TetR-like C-terminal domain-containing protein [Rhodococcus sp. ARC_M6]|uniref:TetR-like C-terminal domain-containing protein n=1 Tax=Rhodococcus sp. ARC_M6 TaxID=2928852 RepID=UPI001FB3C7C5|nr:TetR/AcrR family transcriptional regulator [Rhodococcus sp. ARC_M6]MCJ0904922.1 TetR/AcrR family transcriptional regulator [Rhodococcus sp. ARC_M6]